MKVLCIVQDRGIRAQAEKGAAVHAAAMQQAFRQLGHEVHSLYARDAQDTSDQLRALETGNQGVSSIDWVYERYGWNAHTGSRWAQRHSLPHVLEVNAPLEWEIQRWRVADTAPLDAAAEHAMFAQAHRVICVSAPVAEYARKRGAAPERTEVIPNGVDTQIFRPDPHKTQTIARWFPALHAPVVVGFHGRLRPWHGFERIADAVAGAIARGANLAMACIGKGDFASVLTDRLPAERVYIEPWCPQSSLGRAVAAFDLLPLGYAADLPYYFSPLKLREAMAAGAVPIVPDLGDLAETVEGGRAGWIYDSREDHGLEVALLALAQDPGRRELLRIHAERIGQQHSWQTVAQRILNALPQGEQAQ